MLECLILSEKEYLLNLTKFGFKGSKTSSNSWNKSKKDSDRAIKIIIIILWNFDKFLLPNLI